MSTFDIIMPKLGESVEEATITKWFIKPGDKVEEDQSLLEIATDKVDSEIPSPVEGVVVEVKYEEDAVVAVGEVIAVISLDGEAVVDTSSSKPEATPEKVEESASETPASASTDYSQSDKFYSPLVKSIAKEENISLEELDTIAGSGKDGRVTKDDVLSYISNRGSKPASAAPASQPAAAPSRPEIKQPTVVANEGEEIVEMDRIRKLIADSMVMSKQVSPHVTSIVEADVTNLVIWRNKVKDDFQKKYGTRITFMPLFVQATAKALRDFPGINVSVDGTNIIYRKDVNVGMAVALPSGNLIVPVIKNADQKNLVGLANDVNSLASKARENKLSPDDIRGGTFTITNFGSFQNAIGTPIINQPEVAILATGTIEKKPAVIETPTGDVIAIRHKMYLSLSYDHRVVDGALGGFFLRRIADYLEQWDIETEI